MIIYLIYLIEEHTFNPPRKLELCYPLEYIDENGAIWLVRLAEEEGKMTDFRKNYLKIRKTQGLIYKRKFSKKLSSRGVWKKVEKVFHN